MLWMILIGCRSTPVATGPAPSNVVGYWSGEDDGAYGSSVLQLCGPVGEVVFSDEILSVAASVDGQRLLLEDVDFGDRWTFTFEGTWSANRVLTYANERFTPYGPSVDIPCDALPDTDAP